MNIGDENGVKQNEQKVKDVRRQELDDLRLILKTVEGRRFLWRLLTETRVFNSIWRQSAEIHYLAGRQDIGHFIQGEINEANSEYYFQMMRENMDKEKTNG